MTYKHFLAMQKEAAPAGKWQRKLNDNGIPATINAAGHLQLPSDPLAVPKGLFKPTAANYAKMQQVEAMTQQNRARIGNKQYKPGIVYPVPTAAVFGGSARAVIHNGVNNAVGVGANAYKIKPGARAYAPGFFFGHGAGVLPSKIDLGTLLHENNHYFANLPGIGTESSEAVVNPYFRYGDAADTGQQNQTPFSFLRTQQPNRLTYPQYFAGLLPDSYYNSGVEAYTAARSLKQYAASRGYPSVGASPTMSDDTLANGTAPFHKAMLNTGLWKLNPRYTGKLPQQGNYAPKFLPGKKPNTDNRSVNRKLWKESGEMMKHFNMLQYLIDLGDRRTPEQTKQMQLLQQRLPIIMETARNNRYSQYSGAC